MGGGVARIGREALWRGLVIHLVVRVAAGAGAGAGGLGAAAVVRAVLLGVLGVAVSVGGVRLAVRVRGVRRVRLLRAGPSAMVLLAGGVGGRSGLASGA